MAMMHMMDDGGGIGTEEVRKNGASTRAQHKSFKRAAAERRETEGHVWCLVSGSSAAICYIYL